MTATTEVLPEREIVYPDSDGQPMADNTKQFRWIVTIQGSLDSMFSNQPDVFVAGDLLWYPVEGDNKIRLAPDVMVIFGRPKGDRGSYQQWREDNVTPQVVFEILSPGNTMREMAKKFEFYDRYGVEEYYIYDPDTGDFNGWLRVAGRLHVINQIEGWLSPRLGVRFEFINGELRIYRLDGKPFASYIEIDWQAEQARQQAETERLRANAAEQQLDAERRRVELLAAKLRAMGIDPDTLT